MNQDEQIIKLDLQKKKAHLDISVFHFEEGGQILAYMPALNLSSYGDDANDALKSLIEVVLMEYLQELLRLPEHKIMAELRQFGWERRPFLAKQLRNIVPVDTNTIIKDFDLPAETVIKKELVTV